MLIKVMDSSSRGPEIAEGEYRLARRAFEIMIHAMVRRARVSRSQRLPVIAAEIQENYEMAI